MGKSYSGNGTKAGLLVFIIAILIFYGLAIYSILKVSSNFVDKIETSFFWSIAILLLSIVISFIVNFNTERKRLENTELIKTFFEPAGNIFPVYLSVILLAVFRGQAGVLIIIIKTFADIIINSPLNAENPFIFKLLGGDDRLIHENK